MTKLQAKRVLGLLTLLWMSISRRMFKGSTSRVAIRDHVAWLIRNECIDPGRHHDGIRQAIANAIGGRSGLIGAFRLRTMRWSRNALNGLTIFTALVAVSSFASGSAHAAVAGPHTISSGDCVANSSKIENVTFASTVGTCAPGDTYYTQYMTIEFDTQDRYDYLLGLIDVENSTLSNLNVTYSTCMFDGADESVVNGSITNTNASTCPDLTGTSNTGNTFANISYDIPCDSPDVVSFVIGWAPSQNSAFNGDEFYGKKPSGNSTQEYTGTACWGPTEPLVLPKPSSGNVEKDAGTETNVTFDFEIAGATSPSDTNNDGVVELQYNGAPSSFSFVPAQDANFNYVGPVTITEAQQVGWDISSFSCSVTFDRITLVLTDDVYASGQPRYTVTTATFTEALTDQSTDPYVFSVSGSEVFGPRESSLSFISGASYPAGTLVTYTDFKYSCKVNNGRVVQTTFTKATDDTFGITDQSIIAAPHSWDISISGNNLNGSPFELDNGATTTGNIILKSGVDYAIGEIADTNQADDDVNNYILTGITCTGSVTDDPTAGDVVVTPTFDTDPDTQEISNIELNLPSAAKTTNCTLTNTLNLARIGVTKTVDDPSIIGAPKPTPTEFTVGVTGTSLFSADGYTYFAPGEAMSVTEIGNTDLAKAYNYETDLTCNDTSILDAKATSGGTAVTENVTDTQIAAKLGDTVDCRFNNKPLVASLQLKKEIGSSQLATADEPLDTEFDLTAAISEIATNGDLSGTYDADATDASTGSTWWRGYYVTTASDVQISEALNATADNANDYPFLSDLSCTNNGVDMAAPVVTGVTSLDAARGTIATIGDGDQIICTFVNTPQVGKITVEKTLNKPALGALDDVTAEDWLVGVTGVTDQENNPQTNAFFTALVPVDGNAITITETTAAFDADDEAFEQAIINDFTVFTGLDCGSAESIDGYNESDPAIVTDPDNAQASFVPVAGGDYTCTFTNEIQLASITMDKDLQTGGAVFPANSTPVEGTFTLTLDGFGGIDSAGVAKGSLSGNWGGDKFWGDDTDGAKTYYFKPGSAATTFTVSETDGNTSKYNYTAGVTCSGATGTTPFAPITDGSLNATDTPLQSGAFSISSGDEVQCFFTNTLDTASVTLTKSLTGLDLSADGVTDTDFIVEVDGIADQEPTQANNTYYAVVPVGQDITLYDKVDVLTDDSPFGSAIITGGFITNTSVDCTNTTGDDPQAIDTAKTTLFDSATVVSSHTITPVKGAAYDCTFTNNVKLATITLSKLVNPASPALPANLQPKDQEFTLTVNGLRGFTTDNTSLRDLSGFYDGVEPTNSVEEFWTKNGSAVTYFVAPTTDVELQEETITGTNAANYAYASTLECTGGKNTSDITAFGAAADGSVAWTGTTPLKSTSFDIETEDQITCHFTNTPQTAKIVIDKIVLDPTDENLEGSDWNEWGITHDDWIVALTGTGDQEAIPQSNGHYEAVIPAETGVTITEVEDSSLSGNKDVVVDNHFLADVNCGETNPPNWEAAEGNQSASFTAAAGETYQCYFENTLNLAKIWLEKDLATIATDVKFPEGTAKPEADDFTLAVSGAASSDIFDNSLSGTNAGGEVWDDAKTAKYYFVKPGTYKATETDSDGFTYTSSVDCGSRNSTDNNTGSFEATDIVLAKGQSATCIFSNALNTATLTVEKTLDPSGDAFGIVPADWNVAIVELSDADGTAAGTVGPVSIPAGTYTVSEAKGSKDDPTVNDEPIDQFAVKDLYCGTEPKPSGAPDNPVESEEVTLQTGDVTTCTFTNTLSTGLVTLTKEVVLPEGTQLPAGVTLPSDDEFTLKLAGKEQSENQWAGGEWIAAPGVDGYQITEDVPTTPLFQYTAEVRCSNDVDPAKYYDLATYVLHFDAGKALTCDVKNTIKVATLTVEKALDPAENDLGITVNDWNMGIDGFDPIGARITKQLPAGDYNISEAKASSSIEIDQFDLAADLFTCGTATVLTQPASTHDGNSYTAQVRLGDGDEIICTFTNTLSTGRVTLTKEVVLPEGTLLPAGVTVPDDDGFGLYVGPAGDPDTDTGDDESGWKDGKFITAPDPNGVGYLFSETLPETPLFDYTQEVTCDGGETYEPIAMARLQFVAGEDVACEIRNTVDVVTVTLEKTVDHGGLTTNTASADDWALSLETADGVYGQATTLVDTGDDTAAATSFIIPTGEYSLAEAAREGLAVDNTDRYTLTSLVCNEEDVLGSKMVTITDDTVCEFTNTRVVGGLTVNVDVINDNGGTAHSGDFLVKLTSADVDQVIGTPTPGVSVGIDNDLITLALIDDGVGSPFSIGSDPLVDQYTVTALTCVNYEDESDVITITDPVDDKINAQFTAIAGGNYTCTYVLDDNGSGFDMVKSATASADPLGVGDNVTFTYEFSNPGPWPLYNVSLTSDSFVEAVEGADWQTDFVCQHAVIDVGASTSCTYSYTITQEDLDGNGFATEIETEECTSGWAIQNAATAIAYQIVDDLESEIVEALTVEENDLENNAQSVCIDEQRPDLDFVKSVNNEGPLVAGDVATYSFTVTNTGNVTLSDIVVDDQGLENVAGKVELTLSSGVLSNDTAPTGDSTNTAGAAEWSTLAPGDAVTFTASYTVTEADQLAAGDDGLDGEYEFLTNVAIANARFIDEPITEESEVDIEIDPLAPVVTARDYDIAKLADVREVVRGQVVNYTIVVTNNTGNAGVETVIDRLPKGMTYVPGSGRGAPNISANANGSVITFADFPIAGDGEVRLTLQARMNASATPGKYTNRASITYDSNGEGVLVTKTATVDVILVAEAVFDCSDLIGKVFDDQNRNGYQDQGEGGIAGARLISVNGEIITADDYGRFHVPCASLPRDRIGSNYILKLDTNSLPAGHQLTTPNPRHVRLTAGKMTEMNFGVALGDTIEIVLNAEAFDPRTNDLTDALKQALSRLAMVRHDDQLAVHIAYRMQGAEDSNIADIRLEAAKRYLKVAWRNQTYKPLRMKSALERVGASK